MTRDQQIEQLVCRVQNGLLVGATLSTIRAQLESEGVDAIAIQAAIVRGERAFRVRIGGK